MKARRARINTHVRHGLTKQAPSCRWINAALISSPQVVLAISRGCIASLSAFPRYSKTMEDSRQTRGWTTLNHRLTRRHSTRPPMQNTCLTLDKKHLRNPTSPFQAIAHDTTRKCACPSLSPHAPHPQTTPLRRVQPHLPSRFTSSKRRPESRTDPPNTSPGAADWPARATSHMTAATMRREQGVVLTCIRSIRVPECWEGSLR